MKELLEYLARGLVEEPDEVRVDEVREDDGPSCSSCRSPTTTTAT